MSGSERRYYSNTTLDLVQRGVQDNYVKVTYTPVVAAKIVLPGEDESSTVVNPREYQTSSYSTLAEAFSHAKGWVDAMMHFYSCRYTPDDDEDSYKKKYKEKLEEHKNNPDDQDKTLVFSESAYKEGWDKKESELKN